MCWVIKLKCLLGGEDFRIPLGLIFSTKFPFFSHLLLLAFFSFVIINTYSILRWRGTKLSWGFIVLTFQLLLFFFGTEAQVGRKIQHRPTLPAVKNHQKAFLPLPPLWDGELRRSEGKFCGRRKAAHKWPKLSYPGENNTLRAADGNVCLVFSSLYKAVWFSSLTNSGCIHFFMKTTPEIWRYFENL